jgi:hypothetical protein
MDIEQSTQVVYAPITIEEMYFWHPPDEARKIVVDAVHDSKRNSANFGISRSDYATA